MTRLRLIELIRRNRRLRRKRGRRTYIHLEYIRRRSGEHSCICPGHRNCIQRIHVVGIHRRRPVVLQQRRIAVRLSQRHALHFQPTRLRTDHFDKIHIARSVVLQIMQNVRISMVRRVAASVHRPYIDTTVIQRVQGFKTATRTHRYCRICRTVPDKTNRILLPTRIRSHEIRLLVIRGYVQPVAEQQPIIRIHTSGELRIRRQGNLSARVIGHLYKHLYVVTDTRTQQQVTIVFTHRYFIVHMALLVRLLPDIILRIVRHRDIDAVRRTEETTQNRIAIHTRRTAEVHLDIRFLIGVVRREEANRQRQIERVGYVPNRSGTVNRSTIIISQSNRVLTTRTLLRLRRIPYAHKRNYNL